MNKSLKYKTIKSKNSKVKTFRHYFQLESELSYEYVGDIIDSLIKYYHYNPETGFLEAKYLIPKKVRGKKNRTLSMFIFVEKWLSNIELNKIIVDSKFQYNVDTGVLTIIHKIKYPYNMKIERNKVNEI